MVDDVGYIPFEAEAANLFLRLVSSSYERAFLIAGLRVAEPVLLENRILAWTAVRTMMAPSAWITASNDPVKFEPRLVV